MANINKLKSLTSFMLDVHYKTKLRGSRIIQTNTDYCECIYSYVYNEIRIFIAGTDEKFHPGSSDWFGKSGNLNHADVNSDGIHDGFANAYANLREDIHNCIEEIANSIVLANKTHSLKIVVIGYSRGGGIAIPLLMQLKKIYNINISAVLFGAPPVLDKEAQAKFMTMGIDILRVVNGWDLVSTARVYKKVGLVHVGKQLTVKQPFWHYLPHKRIDDHRIENYWRGVHKL